MKACALQGYVDDVVFFFQAEDGIRDWSVTGVQTCALPIWLAGPFGNAPLVRPIPQKYSNLGQSFDPEAVAPGRCLAGPSDSGSLSCSSTSKIGRASCRERV